LRQGAAPQATAEPKSKIPAKTKNPANFQETLEKRRKRGRERFSSDYNLWRSQG